MKITLFCRSDKPLLYRNKTYSQFNILSLEMESAADALRDWIGKAQQCQDKVKSID